MGSVYEATRVGIDRKVALKLLHAKYAKSAKIVKRFHLEARLAGSIEHDNICRVTDHGSAENGSPYLVMPLLTGRSLAKWLESGDPISQMQVIDIACQTLLALEAAHKEKIVHRDLKPDNIFVTKIGDRDDFVKLLDFGISKVLEQESVTDLTSTGMVLGTAYYLAPEQARGAKRIDHRVDIYAMGVILYEALTGTRPFEGDTYNEVMFKIAGEPFKTPRSLNASISPAVEHVILKAMAIDPVDRYATALEMCEALEKAAVSSLSPGDSSMTDTLADTTMARSVAPRSRSAKRRRLLALVILLVIAGAAVAIWIAFGDETGRKGEPVHVTEPIEKEPSPAEEKVPPAGPPKIESANRPGGAPDTGVEEQRPSLTQPEPEVIPNDESKKLSREGVPPKPTPRRRHGDNKVIKGRNNTTFIFKD